MKYSLAPRTAGLWGIPDGFAVRCLQNLLIVEPTPLSWLYRVQTPISAQKSNAHIGHLIFVAEYDFITNHRIQIPILQGIYLCAKIKNYNARNIYWISQANISTNHSSHEYLTHISPLYFSALLYTLDLLI